MYLARIDYGTDEALSKHLGKTQRCRAETCNPLVGPGQAEASRGGLRQRSHDLVLTGEAGKLSPEHMTVLERGHWKLLCECVKNSHCV